MNCGGWGGNIPSAFARILLIEKEWGEILMLQEVLQRNYIRLLQFKWNDCFEASIGMNPRICRCCGEAIAERGNQLSRNPNVCASCSSMMDGMEESRDREAPFDPENLQHESDSDREAVPRIHIFD